jgi:hypothetical protein
MRTRNDSLCADKTAMDINTRRDFAFLAVASVLGGMIALLWPADTPWINDEPALLAQGWDVVHKMGIPSHGLSGSVGLSYGPVPVLIYALGLLFTHSLVLLVFLRAFFFMLAIGVAVWWLASMCRTLSPPIGALALLSPYYWFYSRSLWDNSFLIPFSALTLAAYISFCRTRAVWKLGLVGLGMVLMFLTHLMCLPFLASITAHFIWQHRSWAVKHARQCLTIAIIGLLACLPYVLYLARHLAGTKAAVADGNVEAWFFPLTGGRFFSAVGFDYFLGENWQRYGRFSGLLWMLTGLSALGFLGVWIGLAEAWRFLVENRGTSGDKPLEYHLWSVVCLTLALQMVVDGVSRTSYHPHYLNATSFGAFTLLWLAYSQVRNSRWRWTLSGLHAVALLIITLSIMWRIHETQGNTNIHYGPTLRTQMDILKELDFQNPNSTVVNQTSHYAYFPHAFTVLQTFYPLHQPSTNAPVRHLAIRYADPQSGAGRLVVTDIGQ